MPKKDHPHAIGRAPEKIADDLRAQILSGEIPAGTLLPSTRDISRKHHTGLNTVNLAARLLMAEGLVSAEPRRGYRVIFGADQLEKTRPVAFIADQHGSEDNWERFSSEQRQAFQDATYSRAMPFLGIGAGERPPEDIMRQLSGSRTWGVLLDHHRLLPYVCAGKMPVVIVDPELANVNADSVTQDNFQGAFLAADYLLSRRHRRIAWMGPINLDGHSLMRLSGAHAAFLHAGLEWPKELRQATEFDSIAERARTILKGPNRPTAILALWRRAALAVAEAAHSLGIRLGRDLELVGWCAQEQLERDYYPYFAGAALPATVVWSLRSMANLAIARLCERRINPLLEKVTIHVPVTLQEARPPIQVR